MSLLASSELLLRNQEELQGKKLLVVNPDTDGLAAELEQIASSVEFFTTDFLVYQQLSTKYSIYYDWPVNFAPKSDTLVVFYPKSKAEFPMLLSQLLPLSNFKEVYVVGDNKGGIKSGIKALTEFDAIPNKLDNARHCLLFHADLEGSYPKTVQDYSTFEVDAAGRTLPLRSLPGVFSHKELDVGTRLLLEHLPAEIKGKVLDFACGCGVIGTYIARFHDQAQVDMLDVSSLAIASAKATAEHNRVTANVFASNGLKEVQQNYDLIVSNPPFHRGIKTHYSVTETFLEQAKQKLSNKGKLIIVANGFLKYEPILQQHFRHVTKLAKTKQFIVYQAEK